MRSTYVYAMMKVQSSTYDEIRGILEEAGYEHTIQDNGAIILNGIAISKETEDQTEAGKEG